MKRLAVLVKNEKVDAIYMLPAWGLDIVMLGEFFKATNSDKVPIFTYEGNSPVTKGAMASNSNLNFVTEARFNAWKVLQIINGTTPAPASPKR